MKVDPTVDGPLTVFVDALRLDAGELKEQAVFVSPNCVLGLIEHIGFFETVASRRRVEKMELHRSSDTREGAGR